MTLQNISKIFSWKNWLFVSGWNFPRSFNVIENVYRIHQRVHQEEKPFVCKQANCGKAFKTQSELSKHEFRHTGQKPFKCYLCEKSFVRNDDLKRHHFTHTGQISFFTVNLKEFIHCILGKRNEGNLSTSLKKCNKVERSVYVIIL